MAFVPFIDGALAIINLTAGSNNLSVTSHWQGQSGVLPSDYTALAASIGSEWRTNIQPLLSISCDYIDTTVYDLNSEASPVYTDNAGTGAPGMRTGDIAPLNCAMIATMRTNLRGRSYRGRMYIPALGELDLSSTDWNSAAVSAMQSGLDTWRANVEAATVFSLSVASRVLGGTPRTLGLMTPVSDILVRSYIGTRRKRL